MISKYRPTKNRSLTTGRHKSVILADLSELKAQNTIDGDRLRAIEAELASVDSCPDFFCDDWNYIGGKPPPPTPPKPHPMAVLAYLVYLCELAVYKYRHH